MSSVILLLNWNLELESGNRNQNQNPESGIRNLDIKNDDRNNSLQQCPINKYRENIILLLFIFYSLLQPQTVIVKKNYRVNLYPVRGVSDFSGGESDS